MDNAAAGNSGMAAAAGCFISRRRVCFTVGFHSKYVSIPSTYYPIPVIILSISYARLMASAPPSSYQIVGASVPGFERGGERHSSIMREGAGGLEEEVVGEQAAYPATPSSKVGLFCIKQLCNSRHSHTTHQVRFGDKAANSKVCAARLFAS